MKTKKSLRSRLPVLAGGILLLLFMIAVVLMIRSFMKNEDKPDKPRVQQISILKPPPPKPEEKPPEPEKQEIKQDVNIPEPQQDAQPDEPPPGQSLALDAAGTAGTDGFGLGANKGGKSLIGGGGGSRFGWYTGTIQQAIQDAMTRNQPKGEFRAIVKLWVNSDGSIKRYELAGSSGKAEIDSAIESALERLKGLKEPPEDMPQPIKLRISSR
ncbi:MAG: TonB family protein [Sulfuricella sp.]|jgi:protein TonB